MNPVATGMLLLYGDIAAARKWLAKSATIFEGNDWRKDPTLLLHGGYGSYSFTNSYLHQAGLKHEVLRLMKARHVTFTEVEASAEVSDPVCGKLLGFVSDTHEYGQMNELIALVKRRHWLLAPDEIAEAAMLEWLAGVPAEWGSAGQGERISCVPCTMGMLGGGDCAEVFESLGRYEEAITAAQTDVRNYDLFTTLFVQSHAAIGRSQAKLGRVDEAAAAFETAILKAREWELPFHEMLAIRDFIVHVLDKDGKRDTQVVSLGGCISRMAMQPADYTDILGCGIDAEAAVTAFKSDQGR